VVTGYPYDPISITSPSRRRLEPWLASPTVRVRPAESLRPGSESDGASADSESDSKVRLPVTGRCRPGPAPIRMMKARARGAVISESVIPSQTKSDSVSQRPGLSGPGSDPATAATSDGEEMPTGGH
jgi:hypothetical protein